MKPRLRLGLLLLAAAAAPGLTAQTADILPPQRREPVVAQAEQLAAAPRPPARAEDLRNPFVTTAPVAAPTPAGTVARPAVTADRDRLETLAPLVTPSGVIHLGGQPHLLFGQKRIKVGDPLPITFDGQPYVLVISAIDRTSFTLRLNGEEITRPIKPSNRP